MATTISNLRRIGRRARDGRLAFDRGWWLDDWFAFVLEVLRLLPIFLALPMFVMAYLRRGKPNR